MNIGFIVVGGAGANTGALLAANLPKRLGTTDTTIYHIDTSTSDTALLAGVKRVVTIKTRDSDGAGANRALAHKHWLSNKELILGGIKDHDFYFVIFSGGGATGSVLGPEIASELRTSGKNVMACFYTTTNSVNAANASRNTIRTIALKAKVKDTNYPMVVIANEECNGVIATANSEMVGVVLTLAEILQPHGGIDTQDIATFMRNTYHDLPRVFIPWAGDSSKDLVYGRIEKDDSKLQMSAQITIFDSKENHDLASSYTGLEFSLSGYQTGKDAVNSIGCVVVFGVLEARLALLESAILDMTKKGALRNNMDTIAVDGDTATGGVFLD